MKNLCVAAALGALLSACSSQLSSLRPEGSPTAQLYVGVDEAKVLEIALSVMQAAFPGETVLDLPGTIRGFVVRRTASGSVVDSHHETKIKVFAAKARGASGEVIAGHYFEVS